jgi:molecular chaperone HtpG
MQITETPQTVEDLDLMKRLHEYADGRASWTAEGDTLGNGARRECTTLYSNILSLVHHVLTPLLDRVHAREMETFTLHDRRHALKVAHLMWHILEPGRQTHLTPPEIAMLVLVAYLHDLGMGLSPEERQARLTQQDLWERLEWEESARTWINGLREKLRDPTPTDTARARLELELFQAEEALLCRDTRERHASPERYRELLERLAALHEQDRDKIPDIDSCLTFDGDSFREKLLDICVSHNEDAEALLRRDATDPAYPRFPGNFPVGSATADLLMVGCALRLSDILDFDRERTPPALFLSLSPGVG